MFFASQSWLHDLEENMKSITTDAYNSLLAKLWWQEVAIEKPSMSKKETLVWLISTATIKQMESGQADFEDIISQYTQIENQFASAGLVLNKDQMEDVENGLPGGAALRLAAQWSRDVGKYAAYWPQKLVAAAILNGATAGYTTYDGLTFFNTAHYVNGVDSADGTFANILNPTTVGHATRIDTAVTADAAVDNLSAIRAYIASIAMPNGVDPRNLEIKSIIHPPALRSRVVQLTGASLIAQAATSGGGGADITPIIEDWNFDKPVEAPELGAAFGGSDTSYYIKAAPIADNSDDLGALVYQNRESFNILYHGPEASDRLARERKLQWLSQGRNTVGYGHPYLLFKVNVS